MMINSQQSLVGASQGDTTNRLNNTERHPLQQVHNSELFKQSQGLFQSARYNQDNLSPHNYNQNFNQNLPIQPSIIPSVKSYGSGHGVFSYNGGANSNSSTHLGQS